MKKDWYKNSFRRHLMDMHIEDWNEEFLSKFDPVALVENLKNANIQAVMLYAQSHNGLASYPTKIGKVHNAFQKRPNMMKEAVDLCRQEGLSVMIYYSLIYNNYAYETYPEWRVLTDEGKGAREYGGRYGLCCPNNPDYKKYVKGQLKEVVDYFDFEGFFFDMTFWPWHCQCEHCKARWAKESGGKPIPKSNLEDEEFRAYHETYCRWMGEFAKEISDYALSLRPELSVAHNYANSIAGDWFQCGTEYVNDACTYTSGDLYGGLRNHSFTVKYYNGITQNAPCEYMIGKCDPDLKQHTVNKTNSEMEKEVMLNVVHNAATLVIDAIDPDGGMDERSFRKIGNAFTRAMTYEKFMDIEAKMMADVGVMYSTLGKYSAYNDTVTHKACSIGAMDALCAYHVPADVIIPRDVKKFGDYKCLVLGLVDGLKQDCVDAIHSYVEAGGSVYFSGKDKRLLKTLLNAEYESMTEHGYTYVAPNGESDLFEDFNERYPFPIDSKMPIVRLAEEEGVVAKIKTPYTLPEEAKFASIHSNPPGLMTEYPAVVVRTLGKGKVVWSAAPIEGDGRYVYQKMFLNIINLLLPQSERSLYAKAPHFVETVAFKGKGYVQVGAVDFTYDEERRKVNGFPVRVRASGAKKVVRLPNVAEIPFTEENGYVTFETGDLDLGGIFRVIV